ncbi:uncharacterized protein C8Q71DRAFT_778246 [Rhodofomes roseus]|uniref:Uncharacterized protein n=1 Tax=Rhodofomes roseus TaxID=34475 RepID=A0ABQ8K5L9_9APHY|nr:uncharacterized protein C8Q71DRAFT_778246 [Rhodofomes roseus]KAH9832271.1 hypothetical protein C8Q71DRAFT_778246 [Rhodofomes roseus]
MSDTDAVSSFSSLDELVQVIYQGSSRFVVLSSIDDTHWKVRLGLSDSNGRWWEGRWGEKEIRQAAKSASCSSEKLGDTLAAAFAQGEMYVGNWSSRKGAEINFVLGTNTNHPANVALAEMTPEEAASFAMQVFADIAIQAQSRGSRIHPSPFEPALGKPAGAAATSSPKASGSGSRGDSVRRHDSLAASKPAASTAPGTSEQKAQKEIKALKAELARERSKRYSPPTSPTGKHKRKADDDAESFGEKRASQLRKEKSIQESSKLHSIAKGNRSSAATMAARGASLANPSKKARKYQTVEFGSDDDD